MKKCLKCNDLSIYEDDVMVCPLCDSTLSPYIVNKRRSTDINDVKSGDTGGHAQERVDPQYRRGMERGDSPVDSVVSNSGSERTIPFETRSFGRYTYRGNLVEHVPVTRYFNRFHKLVNCLFRGEPYQFGHSTHYSTLRIEEQVDGMIPAQRRDVIFYGDVEGRFTIGDDVVVTAKRKHRRYVVTRMYVNDTETLIRPSLQLPAPVVNLLLLIFILVLIALVLAVISFFATGAFITVLASLLQAVLDLVFSLGSIILSVVIVLLLLRVIIRGRR